MDDKTLSGFFEGLNAGLKTVGELQKCYDETMAFDFNALNFLCPNENKVSEILSYFLDPNQGHGQGKKFLEQFCEYISKKVDTKKNTVKLQIPLEKPVCVRTEEGRIDIIITFGNCDFVIGIESKIWGATEQPDQLSRYSDYLNKKTGGRYILVYLTPNGDEPTKFSIPEEDRVALEKEGKLIFASGNHDFINIIERFISVCKAQRVRYFLEEFKTYLKKGDELMSTQNYIQNFITGSDSGHPNYDYIKVALNVHSTMQDAWDIWNKLWEDVKIELREYFSGCEMEFAKSCKEMCTDNLFFTIDSGKCKISGEFDKMGTLKGLGTNIYTERLIPQQIAALTKVGYTDTNIGWMFGYPWDCYRESWLTNSQPWLDMIKQDGNRSAFAQAIIDEVEKINNALSVG